MIEPGVDHGVCRRRGVTQRVRVIERGSEDFRSSRGERCRLFIGTGESWPARINSWTTADPTHPVAPVTNTCTCGISWFGSD